MTKEVVPSTLLQGGSGLADKLPAIIRELSGYTVSLVAGAAAGTKMDIAALRTEDTLLAVLVSTDAGGALADDTANCTIQATKASGTLTVSGNPVAAETFVVGTKTYTWRAAPTVLGEVKIVTGDNNAMAANVAAAVNAWENRYTGSKTNSPMVVATVASNVVTFTSVVDGAGNGITITSSDGTDLAVAGTGTASATVTAAAVDNDDNFTINGVTFTAKASPASDVQFLTNNGDNTQQALNIRNVVNAYELKYGTLGVTASANAAVVTFVPNRPLEGNIIVLTEASTNVAVSGSGKLAGGTATGGIKSTTNLSSKSVMVHWLNKR